MQVEDANVSRRHAELRHEGSAWWLVDLDSTNGTELNGKRVQRAKLSEGDTITLGATDIVFGERRSTRPPDARERGNIDVDEALLALKVAFIVLLYLFIWRIVRSASSDFRRPRRPAGAGEHDHATDRGCQPRAGVGDARQAGRPRQPRSRRRRGATGRLDARDLGRGGQNEIPLDGDEFASAQHARFETRRDGLWVEDIGSTNGTFVNGARVTTPRQLSRGDVVRVGQTDLRVEL